MEFLYTAIFFLLGYYSYCIALFLTYSFNINSLSRRIALSWFPQLFNQFPVLRPIITVTEPYLKAFRRTIPPVAGIIITIIITIIIAIIIISISILVLVLLV